MSDVAKGDLSVQTTRAATIKQNTTLLLRCNHNQKLGQGNWLNPRNHWGMSVNIEVKTNVRANRSLIFANSQRGAGRPNNYTTETTSFHVNSFMMWFY